MSRRGRMFGAVPTHAVVLLAGSAVGASFLTLLRIPAGTLVGAVLGSVIVNRIRRSTAGPRGLPVPARTAGLVLLGCAAGVQLDGRTLATLGEIALPLGLAVAALLLLDLALAVVLIRRYDVDSVTAVLACAPGGVSEIAITASQLGADMGVVLAVHSVRVLTVVLLALPALVVVLGAP